MSIAHQIVEANPELRHEHFKWFDLRSFPPVPPILVASSDNLPSLSEAA